VRAEKAIGRNDYSEFEVVLCSPNAYRLVHPEAEFDSFVSYEEIALFLSRSETTDPRGRYRAHFIGTAAVKNANTWIRENDETTNLFWQAAYELATREFPELEMKSLELTKDSTWINFRPTQMPVRPRRIYVSCKGDRGYMRLPPWLTQTVKTQVTVR
jgi:hypothetical protein